MDEDFIKYIIRLTPKYDESYIRDWLDDKIEDKQLDKAYELHNGGNHEDFISLLRKEEPVHLMPPIESKPNILKRIWNKVRRFGR